MKAREAPKVDTSDSGIQTTTYTTPPPSSTPVITQTESPAVTADATSQTEPMFVENGTKINTDNTNRPFYEPTTTYNNCSTQTNSTTFASMSQSLTPFEKGKKLENSPFKRKSIEYHCYFFTNTLCYHPGPSSIFQRHSSPRNAVNNERFYSKYRKSQYFRHFHQRNFPNPFSLYLRTQKQ